MPRLGDSKGFWHYVDKTEGGCWNWTGAIVHGYGSMKVPPGRVNWKAHRVAWALRYGMPPKGMPMKDMDEKKAAKKKIAQKKAKAARG